MLKTTSLASVVVVAELTFTVEQIYSANYKTIPLLMVASLQYLWVTSVLMVGQYYLERHYARGSVRQLPPPVAKGTPGPAHPSRALGVRPFCRC